MLEENSEWGEKGMKMRMRENEGKDREGVPKNAKNPQ
jgi:hypothetical protein